ncbi:MAG: glycoside hydrolase family 3 protein [Clostridia bacterium]|nr:glycoside hydrolase family 3 protein [Clostridia bacterium]
MILKSLGMISIMALLSAAHRSACAEQDEIRAAMEKMSLREKVGQLFVIRPDALDGKFQIEQLEDINIVGSVELTQKMREAFETYPCGGFCLFRKNIVNPEQLHTLTTELHALGTDAPLLAIDEEGGRVARIGNHPYGFDVPRIEPMEEIGSRGDPAKAYEAAYAIGQYLRDYGLDVDFAPVADLNTNPESPVIGNRAFGSDPVMAAKMVTQFLKGLEDAGITGCMKHFPGHGDASADTHVGYAETLKTWDEIRACEMIPFMAGIAAGCEMIMTAHISLPNVTGTEEPSTVSRQILTEKLRGELGYTGLIVTDALAMRAIHEKYPSDEASIRCFLAGADIILMPYDYATAFDGVAAAVEDGRISMERLDESVYRILAFKRKLGLRHDAR